MKVERNYHLAVAFKCPVPACVNEVADPRNPCRQCRGIFSIYMQSTAPEVSVYDFLARQHRSITSLHCALTDQVTVEKESTVVH